MIGRKLFTEVDALLLKDIILNRTAIRDHFIDRPLTGECLNNVIEAISNTQFISFTQPWEFVVIRNKALKQHIKESFETAHLKQFEFFKDKRQQIMRNYLPSLLPIYTRNISEEFKYSLNWRD